MIAINNDNNNINENGNNTDDHNHNNYNNNNSVNEGVPFGRAVDCWRLKERDASRRERMRGTRGRSVGRSSIKCGRS